MAPKKNVIRAQAPKALAKAVDPPSDDDEGESLGSEDSSDEESDLSIHTSDEEMIASSDEEEPAEIESDEEEILATDDDDDLTSEEDDDEEDKWVPNEDDETDTEEEDVEVAAAALVEVASKPRENARYSLRSRTLPVNRYKDENYEELIFGDDSEEEKREGHLWAEDEIVKPCKRRKNLSGTVSTEV